MKHNKVTPPQTQVKRPQTQVKRPHTQVKRPQTQVKRPQTHFIRPHAMVVGSPRPTNWLTPAIFACLCCCWPIGICAIISANNANESADYGDYASAEKHARNARNLVIASCAVGIIIFTAAVVVSVVRYS